MDAVVRDPDGYILAAATWKKNVIPDADIAEAIGMEIELDFCQRLGIFQFAG